jgi:predicted DNA-binding transcriptional regulator AlpA
MTSPILRRAQVMAYLGLKATAFDELRLRRADFPKPSFPFNSRMPIWVKADVEAWLQNHLTATRQVRS